MYSEFECSVFEPPLYILPQSKSYAVLETGLKPVVNLQKDKNNYNYSLRQLKTSKLIQWKSEYSPVLEWYICVQLSNGLKTGLK